MQAADGALVVRSGRAGDVPTRVRKPGEDCYAARFANLARASPDYALNRPLVHRARAVAAVDGQGGLVPVEDRPLVAGPAALEAQAVRHRPAAPFRLLFRAHSGRT